MTRSRYTSSRIAQSMRAQRPVETPDTDLAVIYHQRWRRQDGMGFRDFQVLALDEEMAQEMGGIRLRDKYHQDPMAWTLATNRPCERMTSVIIAILTAEEPDETKVREEGYFRQQRGDPKPFEADL